MEYGTEICIENCNDQFIKHVGYKDNECMRFFYSKNNSDKMSR